MKRFLLMLICPILLNACSSIFSTQEQVEFLLPKISEADSWEIITRCGKKSSSLKTYFSGGRIVLSLEKDAPTSILLYPLKDDEKLSENPFGAVWPWVNEFSSLHGFSAEILSQFYIHAEAAGNSDNTMKAFISRFNWQKFCKELENIAEKNDGYNPWLLNRQKILESIESKSFSAKLLRP